jgi:hypothetical protein
MPKPPKATPRRDLLAAYDAGRSIALAGRPFVLCPWAPASGLKRTFWLRGWDAGRAATIHGVIKPSPHYPYGLKNKSVG